MLPVSFEDKTCCQSSILPFRCSALQDIICNLSDPPSDCYFHNNVVVSFGIHWPHVFDRCCAGDNKRTHFSAKSNPGANPKSSHIQSRRATWIFRRASYRLGPMVACRIGEALKPGPNDPCTPINFIVTNPTAVFQKTDLLNSFIRKLCNEVCAKP